MKFLFVAVGTIILIYLVMGELIASPTEAINVCYDRAEKFADRNLARYQTEKFDAREKCAVTMEGIKQLSQCISKVYAEKGQLRTTLARKTIALLTPNLQDPLERMTADHNNRCSIFPDLLIQ